MLPTEPYARRATTEAMGLDDSVRDTAVVIAHVADLHLDGRPGPRTRFELVAQRLAAAARRVDMIVVTGDLVEARAVLDPAAEYGRIDRLLSPIAPVLYCAGNSDFPELVAAMGPSALQVRGVRVIGIDSTVRGSVAGHISRHDVVRIERSLVGTAVETHVLLALHHPPAALGHPLVDGWRAFGETEALAQLIAASGRVIGTLAGHTHLATSTLFGGVPLLVAPGLHSVGQPGIEHCGSVRDVIDQTAPPAYALHAIAPGGRMVTTFVIAHATPGSRG